MIILSGVLVLAAFALLVLGWFVVNMLELVYVSVGVSIVAALLLGIGGFLQRGEILGTRVGGTEEPRDDSAAEAGEAGEKAELTPSVPQRQERRDEHGDVADARVDATPNAATNAATTSLTAASPAVTPPTSTRATTTTSPTASSTGTSTGSSTGTGQDAAPRAASSGLHAAIPADATVHVVPGRRTYHLANCRQLGRRESDERTHPRARSEGYVACTACMPDVALAARAGAGEVGESDTPDSFRASEIRTGPGRTDTPPVPADPESSSESDEPESDEPESTGTATHRPDAGDQELASASLVGVVHGSSRYHRLSCSVTDDAVQEGLDLTTMSRDEAGEQGCVPCTDCRP